MSIIHLPIVNKISRTIFRPFGKIIPNKYCFAIDGTVKINLSEGKILIFSGNPTSNLVRVLFWKGIEGFEYNAYKVFAKLVKKSGFFMDIGANIGYYSIVAKLHNPNIKVVGFEPLPAAYKYFIKNNVLNNATDIQVEQIALSDKKGISTFYSRKNVRMKKYQDQLVGDSSLSTAIHKADVNAIEVKTETLDNYVKDKLKAGEYIDLIKIDTEATEHLVLKGASTVLSTHRPIIMCEIIKDEIESIIEQIMLSNKYSFYKLEEKGLVKVNSLKPEKSKDDFFMVPVEKEEKIRDVIVS